MTTAIQRRRGTGAQHASFTGLAGEITIDTTDYRAVVHDGVTAGGHPLAKESEVAGFATIASPTFTGTPAAPTAAQGTSTTQIATTAFVRTEVAALADSAPAALDTLNELAAALGDDPNFATTVTNSLALKAPLANPTFTGTPTAPTASSSTDNTQIATTAFVHDVVDAAGGAGAPKRNRIVNPAMQISSVNGNTSGTATGYVPADNWAKYHVSSAGTLTAQRVQSRTPNGSLDRLRVTITAADASLAAGEYLTISQNIVGREVADFQYGTASAIQSILRFGFKGPQGTYAIALHNSALNRSYVSLFTISAPQANTDTEQTITIPGDTSGTWLTDTGTGITVDIVLACGSTFQGTTGWQAGNILGTSGVSNGMGTVSSVFEVFDVGLYADPDSTGAAPEWELPSYKQDVLALGPIILSETQATTSGTEKNFTCPIANPKRATINFAGVSTSGTSDILIQIGDAGGIETSGYLSVASFCGSATAGFAYTTGFGIYSGASTTVQHGAVVLTLVDPSTGTWAASGITSSSFSAFTFQTAGTKSLSANPLDRVRITTLGGADTFDAGKINVLWE